MGYGCMSPYVSSILPNKIDRDTFNGWDEYLRVALSSTIMICPEWWTYEIITLLAGTIGVKELAA